MNEQLGNLVAQGRTSDIYAWKDDQTVVKLFHDWFQFEWIKGEAYRSKQVQSLDLPIPKVGELIQVNGRNGLIFERVYGENMLAMLAKSPELASTFGPRLATIHANMHALNAQPDLPFQRQKLEEKIGKAKPLSDKLKTALIDLLQEMPDGNSICHGDFHPGNVMVTTHGDPGEVIVDWNDCSIGNPLADVARSTILFLGGITGNETPDPSFEESVRDCHANYLTSYLESGSHDKTEYDRWLPIIAGARLNENITALEPWLLAEAEKVTNF